MKYQAKTICEFDRVDLPKADLMTLMSRKIVDIADGGAYFSRAGVFTGAGNMYVVVPWILKEAASASKNHSYTREVSELFSTSKWFFDLLTDSNQMSSDAGSGKEFVYFSMLLKVEKLVAKGIRFNIFRSETTISSNIKGRWLLEKDLAETDTPVLFTCEVDECDRNHCLLSIARLFALQLSHQVKGKELSKRANILSKTLETLVDLPIDVPNALDAAITLSRSDKRFSDWEFWLKTIKAGIAESGERSQLLRVGAGEDFDFDSATFFEDAVEIALRTLGYSTAAQASGKILGGARWISGSSQTIDSEGSPEPKKARNARQRSRPDIYVRRQNKLPLLFECKYKNLKPQKPNGAPVVFNRDDRNQILSFILSQSAQQQFDTNAIVVIYPILESDIGPYETPILAYNANFDVSVEAKAPFSLQWTGDGSVSQRQPIRIYFYGIKIISCLAKPDPTQTNHAERERLKRFIEKLSA